METIYTKALNHLNLQTRMEIMEESDSIEHKEYLVHDGTIVLGIGTTAIGVLIESPKVFGAGVIITAFGIAYAHIRGHSRNSSPPEYTPDEDI